MNGKIVKIAGNDLYGNKDDRNVVIYACFNHKKYMNKYIIFSFLEEYDKKKLYYGSVHFKDKSLISFKENNGNNYVLEFIKEYEVNNINLSEYEIYNIDNYDKIELVSYNEIEDYDKLNLLEEISIKKDIVNKQNENKEKKYSFLYILLFILILFIVGLTYVYFNPTIFDDDYDSLSCYLNSKDNILDAKYESNRTINFINDKIKTIVVVDKYYFNSIDSYNNFKDNNSVLEYFNIDGEYTYNDSLMLLEIKYNDNSIIDSYDEMKKYLEKDGYSCTKVSS